MAKAGTGYHHCMTAIETAAGREISEEESIRLFERLQGRARRYRAGGMSETDALVRAGKELGDEIRLAGVIEKRNKLINIARRREIEGRLTPGREANDLRALITGREGTRGAGGVGDSTDAMVHGITAEVFGPFVAKIRKAGLDKVLSRGDPAFDRDVIRELWTLETGGPAATKNRAAREAAEIIHASQEQVRTMQNAAGAWIGKLDHYITRQSHDMDRIRRAGFEAWRDYILPRLDERTFDTLDEITPASVDDFLRSTYNALASGVHEKANGRVAWGDVGAATGPGNLARRVSQERKLLFRDADAWADYNQTYGRGTLLDAVRGGLETGARNTALMRVWGPNPEAMLDTVTQAAMKRAKDRGDFAAVDALKSSWNERYFAQVTGAATVPGNATLGSITAAAQAWQTLTKLGGVVLASIPDLAVNAAMLRHNGIGLFESYFNQVSSLLPKSAGRREVADLSGAGIDGMLGNIASRFAAMDSTRGTAARMVDLFHKLNLLNWWTESLKVGIGTILTHNMGRLAGVGFDALNPRLRATMERYGITAADWDAVRVTATKAADGRVHILPAMIEDPALRSKFFTYVNDQVREGMTEPDAMARTIGTAGTQAGTPEGMAARLIMQFKTYPITFMRRTLNRELNRADGMDVAGLAHLIVGTTLLGYAAMELKNMARGREPRTANADGFGDYAKLVAAAMTQGGGFGLYGDFLFGDSSRMGSGPVMSLFGPTAGSLDRLASEVQNLRKWVLEGDERAGKDARSGALGLIRDNTPFINMFYTRAALDYLIWYRLQEAMNPGYLARYEDRMRREHDTTFMLSPTASPYR